MNFRVLPFAALLAVAACKKEPVAPPPHVPVTTYECRIGIHAVPPAGLDVTATGTGPTQDEAVAQAWQHVCAALPEANRADCHNAERFSPNIMTATMTATGGPPTATTTIHLEPRPGPDSRGQAHSSASLEDACHQALALACQTAGASGDCISARTHAESFRSTSTTQM